MKKNIIQGLFAAAAIALACNISLAADKPAAAAPEKEKKSSNVPFNGKLKTVDKTANTFSLPGKEKDRVFVVTPQTKITKAGKPATLNDAVVGEDVGGVGKQTADGKVEAVSVRFGPKPEGDAAPKKTDKAEKAPKKATDKK